MPETFNNGLIASFGFLPAAVGPSWSPLQLDLYVLGNIFIVIACYSIPPALWTLAKRRADLKNQWLLALFGVFIFAGGTAHLINIWNIWHHDEWLEVGLVVFTAIVAVICAVGLWPVIPHLLRLPSPQQYRAAYDELLSRHTQLTESEDRYRTLVDTAVEGIWIIDRNGVTTFANQALCDMLLCPKGLVGRSVFEFVFEEDQRDAAQRLVARLAGDRQKKEFRFRRSDGSPLFTLVSSSALYAPNGNITGVVSMVTDISDSVALSKELQQLNLDLGQRVELRTRELEESNRDLAREMVVREYVQAELVASNERLNLYLSALQQHTDDIAQLNELGDQLHACDTRSELVQVLQRSCQGLFATSGGALFAMADGHLSLLEFGWGDCAGLEASFLPEQCLALGEGKPFPANFAQQGDVVCIHRPSLLPALCVPLHSRGVLVGSLLLQRQEPFWTGDDVSDRQLEQLLRALAEHTALALDNLALRERLREQSFTDPLTGLFNRRYLFEQVEREMARWERGGQNFAVMLLDIDHFKRFNDRYGHAVGDEVLTRVGGLLREHTRRSDLACRIGGEEFVVLMAGVEQEQALRRAEAIREAIKVLELKGIAETISISAGVAIYPEHGVDLQGLLRSSDQALYASKHNGRDQTSLAG